MKKLCKSIVVIIIFIMLNFFIFSNHVVKEQGKSNNFFSNEKEVQITDYGAAIRYGIDLNGNDDYTDDWQIFYKSDETGKIYVYMIARDYLNGEALTNFVPEAGCKIDETNSNVIWDLGDRNSIITKLRQNSVWSGLVTKNLGENGGIAWGTPTIEQWLTSWNERYSDNITYQDEKINSNYYLDLADKEGFQNDLYFPYTSTERSVALGSHNGCYGYWLASESKLDTYQLMRVDCDGYIYTSSFKETTFGLRPVVKVPDELVKYDYMFYVDEGNGMEFTPASTPKEWTNSDVEFSINDIKNVDSLLFKIPTSGDEFKSYKIYQDYTGPITISKNCAINIKAKSGIETKNLTYNIKNIDKNAPCTMEVLNITPGYNSFGYEFNFQDEENGKVHLSGLSSIETIVELEDFDGKKTGKKTIQKIFQERPSVKRGVNQKNDIIESNPFYEIFGLDNDKGGTLTFYSIAYDVAGNYKKTEINTVETLKYKIEYDENLPDDSTEIVNNMPKMQEKYHGQSITIDNKIPTRNEYSFMGWSKSPGGEILYYPKSDNTTLQEYKYSDNSNIKLYAIWERIYEITLDNSFSYSAYYGTSSNVIFSEGYTGEVKSLTLQPGTYKLEVWGAQGGISEHCTTENNKGGYSSGIYTINGVETIYIAVGGKGMSNYPYSGGYNGGGSGTGKANVDSSGGGGATHIASSEGELKTLNKDDVIIVAGGRWWKWLHR